MFGWSLAGSCEPGVHGRGGLDLWPYPTRRTATCQDGRRGVRARTVGLFFATSFVTFFFLIEKYVAITRVREKKKIRDGYLLLLYACRFTDPFHLARGKSAGYSYGDSASLPRGETQRMSQERPLKWCGRSAMLLFFFVFLLAAGSPAQ